ncbi:EscF/YscF/HrpA family type III secretion system needle major subunit (plasmid) [Sinorhizobium garamanticum]|uniref:EscF/YscF/HrpA family type III secretion system needle major subunit n=1 Tax=Sinorhizobium garamanticum TaxID=680247 RepID=A0ABY8DLI9_9HYPH|nr:EscF/YscF/HrpA family type III secretion system needle major subunit [Sinorhizobium garamanticum]WEX91758.1 EscF/YscF/HrpA family type III secretion system needle major subunit [Sinorhizobium garamanticum]
MQITGPTISVRGIDNSLGSATVAAETNLNNFMASMDPNNASDLVRFQSLTEQWSLALNLESGMIKVIYDALKGVCQKIN